MNFRIDVVLSAILLAGLLLFATGVLAQPPGGFPPAPVVVAPVVEREIASGQTFVGTVMPRYSATIGSAVGGRVIEMLVEEGDAVQANQPLVRLLTETIQLQLDAAESELELRQQELQELKNGTRKEELEQVLASMRSAEARMKYFQSRRDRTEALFRNGRATSAEERDESISAAVAAEQAFEEARAVHALAVAGPRPERIAQALARVNIQRSVVGQLEDQIKKHTLVSRFDGYLTKKYTEQGQWVTAGDPVVDVVAVEQVEIDVAVVEEHVPFVRVGSQVVVHLPALPGQAFTGTVSAVIPQGDPRSRTFPVKILVENKISESVPLLMPGMLAQVKLAVGAREVCLLVPKDALVLGGPQPVVYVVQPSDQADQPDQAHARSVQLGVADESLVQVIGQIARNEWVVVEGNERLRPGQPVRVIQKTTLRETPVTGG